MPEIASLRSAATSTAKPPIDFHFLANLKVAKNVCFFFNVRFDLSKFGIR